VKVPGSSGFFAVLRRYVRADLPSAPLTGGRGGACSSDVSRVKSSTQRSLAFVWLLLFVLTRLSVAAHQAFTVHVPCPLDGELAHAHGVAEAEHDAEPEPSGSASREDEGHAEHCGFEPATQPATPDTTPALLAAQFAGPPVPEPARGVSRRARERLFLLAPKQSPPAPGG